MPPVLLAACGSGAPTAEIVTQPSQAYTGTAHAQHSYAPHLSNSAYQYNLVAEDYGEVTIGGDVEPRENLRHFATVGGIQYFLGQARDGVGVHRLENYEQDLMTSDGADPFNVERNGFYPFSVQPLLYIDPDFDLPENEGLWASLFQSIRILNGILPPEYQMIWAGPHPTGQAGFGQILVELETPENVRARCGSTALACASSRTVGGSTYSSVVRVGDDFDRSEWRHAQRIIIHELLHALGIQGHVDSVEFPDSIMGRSGEYFPNVGFILGKIDREVLQIMYMSQETETYNDWGEWSDVSHHLMGKTESGDLQFGVALFNGLPQPWARGQYPNQDLTDNLGSLGTATWDGSLLGFSGPSPIAGSAQLRVNLSTVSDPNNEQNLSFRDIYFVNRFDTAGDERWFPARNIDYKVRLFENTNSFINIGGYDTGQVTGSFMGAEHEHMGGTIKRTDMVGAFGGSRK